MAAIARKRSEMTSGARNMLNSLDKCLADILEVKNDSIPQVFRDGRSDRTSFKKIIKEITPAKRRKIDPRLVSCTFRNKELVACTEERLTALMTMEEQSKKGEELSYSPNEVELYQREVEFVCQLIEWGALSREDFQIDE